MMIIVIIVIIMIILIIVTNPTLLIHMFFKQHNRCSANGGVLVKNKRWMLSGRTILQACD